MKISLKALKYYVDINVPVEELCDRMVMAGFEVESIEAEGENIKNVVAARIVKIEPHQDSDHLQICQMDIGADELVQIVTGAQNVFEGALVPAALHDSYLPDGQKICCYAGPGNTSITGHRSGNQMGFMFRQRPYQYIVAHCPSAGKSGRTGGCPRSCASRRNESFKEILCCT